MNVSLHSFLQWLSFAVVAIAGTTLLWWAGGHLILAIIWLVVLVLKTALVLICICWWIGILCAFLELRDNNEDT